MISAEDFLDIVKPQKSQGGNSPAFKLGIIPSGYVSGRPNVQFDGESTASVRMYPYLSSYTPAANDRVMLVVVGNGAVILGKVI